MAFTNPSPDKKYFLKTESEGLPTITAFGKPHYRLSTGFEVDFKANRARALTTRGSVGLTLIDPMTGATRTIETPKGALVSGATWSPDGKSIGYLANFDAAHGHLRRRRGEREVGAGDDQAAARDARDGVRVDVRQQERRDGVDPGRSRA